MAVNINDIVKFTGSDSEFKPYPYMDSRYGPYSSIREAIYALPKPLRCVGLTIGVKSGNSIIEYWFRNGIEDINLVKKADNSYLNYQSSGGKQNEADFYTTLAKIVDTSTYVVLHANVDNVKVEVTLTNGEQVEIGSSTVV